MIFTKDQTERLLNIIDFTTSLFVTTQLGEEVLSTQDRYILNKFGFDIDKIKQKFSPYLQSFMFGRLTAWLSDNQASQVVYSDFEKYLRDGQYIPLTKKEESLYDISVRRSYSHIKNLSNNRKDKLLGIISEEDVRREMGENIKNRESIQNIVSNLGNKTGNWQRDYGRVAETEMNSILQMGRATQIEERFGSETLVWKHTFPLACRHCIRLHCTHGIGSKPILLPLSQVIGNGSNVGRKVADWKFTIDSEHPFCRCILKYFLQGMIWDNEKHDFVWPEKYEQKIKRTKKNKLQVGDKTFWV